jgi:hypothetical protein
LLETLLDEDGISYSRVGSFSTTPGELRFDLNQARRAGQTFDNPIESRLRVPGVEVIVETAAPVPEVVELIGREFAVDPAGSLSIEEAAARDGLSYACPYFLISLDERRLELAEWSRFAGLKLRIEVKTVLQEAWETIDLDLPFYRADSYPPEVCDLLERSALGLSAIDADLAEAKAAMTRLLAEYQDSVASGELLIPLNGISLMAYVSTSALVTSLTQLGTEVGLTPEPDRELDWFDILDLLWLLRRGELSVVAELEEFLVKATPRARDTLAALQRVVTDRDSPPSAFAELILEWLWLVLHRADSETISGLRYTAEIEYALNTLIGNPIARPASGPG